MKKILLIEDRVERQKIFTEVTNIDLNRYSNIIDNQIKIDKKELGNYSTIITHRSAYGSENSSMLGFLKEYCEKNSIQLVFFSGGITSTFYSNEKYEFLLLNSKAFYSENLNYFLDDINNGNEPNLLILGYGKNWKTNLMANILEKINLFINDQDENLVDYDEFEEEIDKATMDTIIKIEYPENKNGDLELDDLKKFSFRFQNLIKEQVTFND